ncbi:restriction endonuclease subunit S, partial [Weissella confusa]|nr:restriction endonuclease subunit S [Weissella confusa]
MVGTMAKIDDSVKKKVPELRFKGFTDDWEERNLSDLATFSKGKGYSKSDLVSDGFPAILYGRMYTNYESQIDDISDTFVADATDAVLSQTGDVIVPGSGETPEDIARASNVNVSGIVLGGDINIIRPDTEKMDSTFLALTISNGQQQTELIKRAQGKSVVHLHNSDLKKVNVVAPSKDEQSAISSLFTQLDNLISANQRKLDLLKEQKKGYLQKMFPKNGAKVPE